MIVLFYPKNLFEEESWSTTSFCYDEIISIKKDSINKISAPFYNFTDFSRFKDRTTKIVEGSPWPDPIDGVSVLKTLFENNYTEYALRSNKIFFYVEVTSCNLTELDSRYEVRRAYAKAIVNKLLQGLEKHFRGMVDLIFADLSCEGASLIEPSAAPTFKFIITFNAYYLPNTTVFSTPILDSNDRHFLTDYEFDSYSSCYKSNHNGLDFFFNNMRHIIEPDDNCPFVVTAFKHLPSKEIIHSYWYQFFHFHGLPENILHTFFYSATTPLWFNLKDPSFFPFNKHSPNLDGLTLQFELDDSILGTFSLLSLADDISTDSENVVFDDSEVRPGKWLFYEYPFMLDEVLCTTNKDEFSLSQQRLRQARFNQLRLEYGLSFLVRRTHSLPFLYDQTLTYCGQRKMRSTYHFGYLLSHFYKDTFSSAFIHLISTYFMLNGIQYTSTGGFEKVNFPLKYEDTFYSCFFPHQDISVVRTPPAEDNLFDPKSNVPCDIVYFLRKHEREIYNYLLSILPDFRYYHQQLESLFTFPKVVSFAMQYKRKNRFKRFILYDPEFIALAGRRAQFDEIIVSEFYEDYILNENKDCLLTFGTMGYSLSSLTNSWFLVSKLDYISTPDVHFFLNSLDDRYLNSSAAIFPSLGFSNNNYPKSPVYFYYVNNNLFVLYKKRLYRFKLK